MVKALPAAVGHFQQFMHRIVEVAADAGAGQPGRLGFQVEHLADLPALPVQARITPGALLQGSVEAGQHGQGDAAVGGDLLAAGEKARQATGVAVQQAVQRQLVAGPLPEEILAQTLGQFAFRSGAACQPIEPRRQTLHAVDEQQQVDPRLAKAGEGHRRVGRHQAAQPGQQQVRLDAAAAIHGLGAASAVQQWAQRQSGVIHNRAGLGCVPVGRWQARGPAQSVDPFQFRPVTLLAGEAIGRAMQLQRGEAIQQALVKGELPFLRRAYPQQHIGVLALDEAGPVQPQQGIQGFLRDPAHHPHLPAEGAGGDGQRHQGVAQVVLAIAIGALAVLPGFAPGDAGKPQQASPCRQRRGQPFGQGGWQLAADFQPVDVRGVVDQQGALLHRARRQQQVGLGGMQIAGGRIDPQCPAAGPRLLPGGDGQAVVEQLRQARAIQWRRRAERGGEHRVVGRRFFQRAMPQLQHARAAVAAEGRRLGRPVELAGPRREAVRAVLAEFVIGTHGIVHCRASHSARPRR
ncbi:hypothetical protein D9M71_72780 [compost metagenome]